MKFISKQKSINVKIFSPRPLSCVKCLKKFSTFFSSFQGKVQAFIYDNNIQQATHYCYVNFFRMCQLFKPTTRTTVSAWKFSCELQFVEIVRMFLVNMKKKLWHGKLFYLFFLTRNFSLWNFENFNVFLISPSTLQRVQCSNVRRARRK